MQVSFVDLKQEWKFFEKKFLSAFKQFGQSGVYVLGREVEKFEKKFAQFCGYKYCVTVSTGLSALEIALRAHGIGWRDEVITVANTAVATALAISNVGAKPVFCDVRNDFLLDPDEIEKYITPRTKAILPVHLFGKVCDMKQINRIAKKHNLAVIEDACQAHGANFSGVSAINTKAFSFYPTKNLGALGEGGAVVTNDETVRDFIASYRNYGQEGRYNHIIKGGNFRLDPFKCKILSIKLKYLKKFIAHRQKIAQKYIKSLQKISGIVVNDFDENCSYHLFVIRVLSAQRDKLREFLSKSGIETLIHYPTPIHRQPCYQSEYLGVALEHTDNLQTEIISLPCHALLSTTDQSFVIKKVKEFYECF